MRYKRLTVAFGIIMVFFVAGNYAVWKWVTEDLVTDRNFDGGDLSRMGYIPASKIYRHNTTDLPRRHLQLKGYDGRRIDMITIGDSFSNGGGGGRNRFYQDYIASTNNFDVLNLSPFSGIDFISTIVMMQNNGFVRQSGARYVLISATEVGWRELARDIDFTQNSSMHKLEKLPIVNHYVRLPQPPFINNGNPKFIVFSLLYTVSEHAFFSKVYKAKLTRPFFSVPAADQLLYLPFRSLPATSDVVRINDNLNKLSDLLAEDGVRLLFVPFPDKYTLYAPWLEHKSFPESAFFEQLRPLSKRYQFVDTKALLREELERGELDIYYADDTHSSWKASQTIFGKLRFAQPVGLKP